MRKTALLLLLAVAAAVAAQETGLEVSAPFVSRLKAQAGQNSVLLTWRESPDLEGKRLVYRGSEELDERSFPRAQLVARLEPAINSYEDFPPDQKPYFYAVLLEDARGRLYKLFIPFRNKTSTAVQVAGLASEETLAARITALGAAVSEDAVRLRFQSSKADRDLLLFRSASLMSGPEDLLAAASPVGLNAGATGYMDYPIPGIGYYYAVVDAGLFKLGKVELVPGQNSTTAPVQVPLGVGRVALPPLQTAMPAAPSQPPPAEAALAAGQVPASPASEAQAPPAGTRQQAGPEAPARRGPSTPLPLLALNLDVASGGELPPTAAFIAPQSSTRPLSPAAQKAVAAVLAEAPPRARPRLQPLALPDDQGVRGDSEAYGLQAILAEQLLPGKYQDAEAGLAAFLSVQRSEPVTARAHFYLAQVYYLQGRFEQSCLELLLAQDRYYAAAQPWLDACLLALQLD
jgi:hypothetical protein